MTEQHYLRAHGFSAFGADLVVALVADDGAPALLCCTHGRSPLGWALDVHGQEVGSPRDTQRVDPQRAQHTWTTRVPQRRRRVCKTLLRLMFRPG